LQLLAPPVKVGDKKNTAKVAAGRGVRGLGVRLKMLAI